jgi:hypothetical protein
MKEILDKLAEVQSWYAKETNREIVKFDDYDLHVCRVAKAYHEAKREDDLLKFAQYINKIGWSIPKNEVDEYLKQRNNG